jgi:hypothetical protein
MLVSLVSLVSRIIDHILIGRMDYTYTYQIITLETELFTLLRKAIHALSSLKINFSLG